MELYKPTLFNLHHLSRLFMNGQFTITPEP